MENQEASKEQFQNELLELSVEKKPHCQIEFQVVVKPALLEKSHETAIKTVSKEASIPGFRKGKAPKDLILKSFPGAVEEKWHQAVANESFQEASKLSNIRPLNTDSKVSFEPKSFSKESAELIFTFECEPLVPELDFSKFSLKDSTHEIEDGKFDEVLGRIRLFFASWQEVKDREAKLGDYSIVDVDILEEDGKENRVFTNTRLEISEKTMAKWMRDLVIGMKAGESKEGLSTVDDDASEEDKKNFEPKKVKVTLKTIEEPVLPPVDDDLAKKVGVDSADIMKERLNHLIEKQAKEEHQKDLREQVAEQLLSECQFDLPKSLLDKEVSFRMQQLMSSPQEKANFNKLSEEEQTEKKKDIAEHAEKAVRLFYLCRKIVMDNKLTFSPEEITKDVKTPLDAMFVDRDLLNPNKSEDQRAMIMSKLMLSTAEDFIVSKVQAPSTQST